MESQEENPNKNRNRVLYAMFGCGGLALVCAVVVAAGTWWVTGRVGDAISGTGVPEFSEEVFELNETPLPEVVVSNTGTQIDTVTINIDGQEQIIDLSATNPERAEQTVDETGSPLIYVEYTEADLNATIIENVMSGLDPSMREQIRNISVDLKPSGIVIGAEASTPLGWQTLGIAAVIDPATNTVDITGIQLGGFNVSIDQAGEYGQVITDIENDINDAIQTSVFSGPNGEPLTIEQIVVTEETLQIIAR